MSTLVIYNPMHYTSPDVYEFISKQTNDPIMERKVCEISWTKFAIFESEMILLNKFWPTIWDVSFPIPSPKLCPEERSRRRLMFRNEKSLYKRKCNATGETIISIYSPDSPIIVYDQKYWWSDQRDPCQFGITYTIQETFFSQYGKLMMQVPMPNVYNTNGENSDYCNHVGDMKDCYLVSASWYCQNCMYGSKLWNCKDCYDMLECITSERCRWCIWCEWCHTVCGSYLSSNCKDSFYLFGCVDCETCIWCRNLVNQKYCIFNKQYAKEEYKREKEKLFAIWHDHIINQRESHKSERILAEWNYKNCTNSFGDRLTNCENCFNCYHLIWAKDCKYSENGADGLFDIMDAYGLGIRSSLNYEIIDTWVDSFKTCFGIALHSCQHTYYSINCHNSSYLFGCIGLRNKQYCILNKQYTKEEYEKLVPIIIKNMQEHGEWGEFFHPSLSPFCYNETVANDIDPLSRHEVVKLWYDWQDKNYDPSIPNDVQTISGDDIPNIKKISDEFLKKIVICEESGRPFRILGKELEMYRLFDLAIPRLHPDVRHRDRVAKRPDRVLYTRKSDLTDSTIISVFKQEVNHKVCSTDEYQKEIFA